MRHLNRLAGQGKSRVPSSGRDRLTRWALNCGAVLGSLCILFAALALIFGLKPLIFASGSMSPAIPTGSLALAVSMPAADTLPGQVVSVVNSQGTRITHRVVGAAADGGVVLKGDANAVADLEPYLVDSVDRVVFSVPGVGFVVSWVSQPWAFCLAGLVCAFFIYWAFIRRAPETESSDNGKNGRSRVRGRRRIQRPKGARGWLGIGALVTVIALAVPLGAAGKFHTTQAAFQGQAFAKAPVAAAVMPPTGILGCQTTGDAQQVDVTWTAPASAPGLLVKNYRITVNIGGNTDFEILSAGVTVKRLSMRDKTTLLGSVLGLLVDLVSLLVPYNYPVTVSVSAIYDNGWESVPQTRSLAAVNGGLLGGGKKLQC